ncbi:reverse transcriptase family protein [Chromohalobacter israelensis]|uniref:RNA-directed DNA polymerase n=1 Tax=Chromohalobacter israelensis (strain ATCC BAA-138 / DSM 3043 / CIP 106854 / NCIMB 13768 / 1H11) TaxID=290398 RepID=Q1QYA1_CHRI1|nr:reverse transcriptase family protein [Chromohalobacter salexigens]ABE58557.1 RNA-directed DNA polymerase (Reverse transcriptase) [Chromohalobacter salexigens DSM 3043]
MEHTYYPHHPINSLKALNRALGIDEDEIFHALSNISYKEVPIKKKDGAIRVTYDATSALKVVQKKVTSNIFHRVNFPHYIHGCIRDTKTPRNIYTNAYPHAGCKQVILCDIKDFFPSIKAKTVFFIFRHCLGFSPNVSQRLTDLCTYNGTLPQGASTSSYIANLAFWDVEPLLVKKLESLGLTYTRFADDITISAKKSISKSLKTQVLHEVRRTIRKRGCSLKKNKTIVLKRSQVIIGKDKETQETTRNPITVTSLSIHHSSVTISKVERRKVRAFVDKLSKTEFNRVSYHEWCRRYSSAMGRVSRLISCGHKEGEPLKQRLKALKDEHKKFHQRSSNVSGRK